MKNYDYHSLFYYGIFVPLQHLVGNNQELLTAGVTPSNVPEFFVAYPRREQHYDHQYQRDQFILNRDRLIIGRATPRDDLVVLLEVKRHEDRVTLYKKALKRIFKANTIVARRELIMLLEKFYELSVDDASPHTSVELSDSPNGSRAVNINALVRLPREVTQPDFRTIGDQRYVFSGNTISLDTFNEIGL